MVAAAERFGQAALDHRAERRAAVQRRTLEAERAARSERRDRRRDTGDEVAGSQADRRDRGRPAGIRPMSPARPRHRLKRRINAADTRPIAGAVALHHSGASSTRTYSSSTRYSKPRTARPVTTPVKAASRITSRERRTSSRSSSLRTSNESGRRALIIRRRHTWAQCTTPEIARIAAWSPAIRSPSRSSQGQTCRDGSLVDRATSDLPTARPSVPSRASRGRA